MPAAPATEVVTPLTRPWERYIPPQATPAGLPNLRASHCGTCHTEIYQEWKSTTHAVAWEDAQFQAEWKKDGELWLCVNCHTPLANQRPTLVTGLLSGDFRRPVTKPNPLFDSALQHESITCAVCHVRGGAVIGPGKATMAAHMTRTDPTLLSQALCEGCHNVQARLSDTLLCSFNTGDEWRANGKEGTADEPKRGCIDCHMPTVERPMVAGGPKRPGRRHTWYGAGIAKLPGDIDVVRAAYQPGYDLELKATTDPDPVQGQASVQIDLAIINLRAGHYIPTGDPERFITLALSLGRPDAAGTPSAPIWTHTERIGEVWEWHPKARRLSENRLAPGERRELNFAVPLPAAASKQPQGAAKADAPLVAEVVALNHRMTEENARGLGILGRYPLHIEAARQRVLVAPSR